MKTTAEIIREAAHEVQRPVFYAIAIIITAYLPIFTLQRVEGRLFRPMAWTVAFALLGAMTFSILIAPVLASMLFRKGVQERRNPVMDLSDRALSPAAALGDRASLGHRRRRRGRSGVARFIWALAESLARSSCLIWMKAPSGRAALWRNSTSLTEGDKLHDQTRAMFSRPSRK